MFEAPLGGFRRTKNRHIGVGGYFQKALAASHNEQSEQEKTVDADRRGRDEEKCTRRANQQAGQNTFLVADALHQPPSGQGGDEITAKKSGLDEGRLKIGETECFL